ncbi:non-specific serine/threonine protein kinase [Malassezia sp. CBS 17886]|nr:non-specific serine/threonine protein kinase [Malassezia sp. CBS 17886]
MPPRTADAPLRDSAPGARAHARSACALDERLVRRLSRHWVHDADRDYTIIRNLGSGSFGSVCVADWRSPLPSGTMVPAMQHSYTRPEYVGKRIVAIKRMRTPFQSWDECLKLNELRSLLTIPEHAHIIPIHDVFRPPHSRELHIVFECMEGNLYQLIKSRKRRPLAQGLVASILNQALAGLDHVHSHGFFHRDMKPENVLITTTGLADYTASLPPHNYAVDRDVLVLVKIADFGLARELNAPAPFSEYISTRWYRAPEILLRARTYGSTVDLWALGTIAAELVNLEPLFPGENAMDTLLRIASALGSPTSPHAARPDVALGGGAWPCAAVFAAEIGFQFPERIPRPFHMLFYPGTPNNLMHMVACMLRYEPTSRGTTKMYLSHPYLREDARLLAPRKCFLPDSFSPAHLASPQLFSPDVWPPGSILSPLASPPDVGAQQRTSLRALRHAPTRTLVGDAPPLHSELARALHLGSVSGPSTFTPPHTEAPRSDSVDPWGANALRTEPDEPRGTDDLRTKTVDRGGAEALRTEPTDPREERASLSCYTPSHSGSHKDSAFASPIVPSQQNAASADSPHLPSAEPAGEAAGSGVASTSGRSQPTTSGRLLSSWRTRRQSSQQTKETLLKQREADQIAMRDRSRAVLQKRTQLRQGNGDGEQSDSFRMGM